MPRFLDFPRMLLIGSGNRNSGKTVFACELIHRISKYRNITAVKVTTVHHRKGVCPRGNEGCGACSEFRENFCLTRENKIQGNKDTQQMLAAGAKRVYWLRALKTHLQEGASALARQIGVDSLVVCESNSLRLAVRPGLFLIVLQKSAGKPKESARKVLPYSDGIIINRGKAFNPGPESIRILKGKWKLETGT